MESGDDGNPRTFTRNDGTPGASYELTAQNFQFLGSRGDNAASDDAGAPSGDADDIPF
jgi:single-strand DNA-binding protein